jgi:hypothetical protein
MSLRALAEQVRKQKEEFEHGLYDEDVRSVPRWQAREAVPSSQLRPGSQKQVLRPHEEEALELQRLGHGNCFTHRKKIFGIELPWERNCAFGIYARPSRVREVMGPTWAGRDPEEVLASPAFYHEILERCHQVELTLTLLASRPLKLQAVRPAVEGALRLGMERLSGATPLPERQDAALRDFVRQLDEKRLQSSGFVKDGAIAEGTHFILATDRRGCLTAEAITPGTLGERKTAFIGRSKSPLVTAAVFDAFLGPNAADEVGRRQTGRGFLWAANGRPFRPSREHGVVVAGLDGKEDLSLAGEEERLQPSTALFALPPAGAKAPRMLLRRLQRG